MFLSEALLGLRRYDLSFGSTPIIVLAYWRRKIAVLASLANRGSCNLVLIIIKKGNTE
jgi:hypothetical protein